MMVAQCIDYIFGPSFDPRLGLYLSLFVAGLVGGVTHCVGMCGSFVISQTENMGQKTELSLRKLSKTALLPYHLGRMTTYVSMAVFFGGIVNLAYLFLPHKNLLAVPLLLLASTIFLINVFPRTNTLFPWASRIYLHAPLRFLSKASDFFMKNPSLFKQYGLGILLGFMPCGLVVSAIMAASTSGTVIESGLAMTAFSIGTMPALILTAWGGQGIKSLFPKTFLYIRKGAMIWSSLWLFALAGWMIF